MANTSTSNARLIKSLEGSATAFNNGDSFKYILTVDNRQGTYEALNVVTTDTLPIGLTYNGTEISYDGGTTWSTLTGVTTSGNGTTTATTITFPAVRRIDNDGKVWGGTNAIATQLGTQDVKYRLTVTANGSAFGSLNNTATAVNGSTEANTADNTGNQAVTINRRSDLAMDKSGPAAIGAGTSITYTLRVWNNGPQTVTGATISDTLPTGLTGATVVCAATGTAVCNTQTITNGVLSATTGNLTLDTNTANTTPDGNFLTYTITATAPANGLLSNTASVTAPSGTTDNTQGNNTTTAVTTRIVDAVNDATVNVAFGAGSTIPVLGNDTIGSATATAATGNVTVTNAGGLTGLTVNGNDELVVPANAPSGSYTVTYQLCDATVAAACNTATVQITVAAASGLTISKSFSPTTITAGNTTTLTITIDNPNSAPASNLSITDNVATTMGYPTPMYLRVTANTCTGTTSASENATGVFTLTGGSISASASCTVTIAFTPWNPPVGTATNTIPAANVTATVSNTAVTGAAPATASLTVNAGNAGGNYICTPDFYQIRQDPTTLLTNMYHLDLSNLGSGGVAEWSQGFGPALNGLAYNPKDGYFYAVNITPFTTGTPFRLFRLGRSGAEYYADLTNIPREAVAANTPTIAAATIDTNGIMYIKPLTAPGGASGGNIIYRYDVSAKSAGNNITLNANTYLWDLAVSSDGSTIYGAWTPGAVWSFPVPSSATTSVTVTQRGTPGAFTNAASIGTLFFDNTGKLYGYQNGGTFGQIDLTTGAFTNSQSAAAATQSDGASCAFSYPKVSVLKTGTAYAKPSGTLTYTLTVKNTSTTSTASGVVLTDTLPAGVTYVSSTPNGTYTAGTRQLVWNIGTLAANTTQTYTVTATAPSSASTYPAFTNTVSVTSSNEQTVDQGDNTATFETRLHSASISKTVQNMTIRPPATAPAPPGLSVPGSPTEVLEYCITFVNDGGVDLNNYVVSDGVPFNTTYVPGSAEVRPAASFPGVTPSFDATKTTWNARPVRGVVTANLGTVPVGKQGQFCFRATIR